MTARDLAFSVLRDWSPAGTFAGERLDGLFRSNQVAPQERRLATELVYGTLRRFATLDVLIEAHVDRPRRNVEPELWTLLQLGAYQLTFLASMADHAAVNETVELAKRTNERWGGFVNAILRKLAATLTDDVLSVPTTDGVPLADGRYRLLLRKLFPDPEDDPAGYFAIAFSFPRWLGDRWLERFDGDDLFELGKHFNGPPNLTLRVNRMKANRDAVIEELNAARVKARDGFHPDSIRLKESQPIESIPGFAEGRLTVQDQTAMHAATLLDPKPGERVLDLCAAPGTKTTHLAEIMGDVGEIVAADVNADRLERVRENVARLGLKSVRTVVVENSGAGLPDGTFDAVLLDVPCSNTGVLGKRPEARWRIDAADLVELPRKQARLLNLALGRTRPGGRVVYSTCSIEPEENEEVLKAVLGSRADTRIIDSRLHMPGDPSDGGFQALLIKKETGE